MIKGKEYKIGKETAKVLIDNGKAKIKIMAIIQESDFTGEYKNSKRLL